jgi:hypothetical protein
MKKILLILISLFCLEGCASIISKSTWPVIIKSIPDQASFVIINSKGETVHNGITPETVNLNSGLGYFEGAKYHIKLSKQGNQDAYSIIDSSLNGWYWGNILFGGIIGLLIIDPATGAMWELPETVSVDLKQSK